MSTFFLFFLLALLTVGQALQQGTADNDTAILTKLTLEDIFSSPNLDKRVVGPFKKKLGMIKVPLVKDGSRYPYWFIEVPTPDFKFKIDTYAVCSSVPYRTHLFKTKNQLGSKHVVCRDPYKPHPDVLPILGEAYGSRIPIPCVDRQATISWEGLLIRNTDPKQKKHGIFGLSLSDSTVPKSVHSLYNLLKNRSPIFALSLSEHGSELHVGGFEDSPEIEWHKVVKTSGTHQPWQIGGLRIFVDNKEIVIINEQHIAEPMVIFDSSTPFIHGPKSEVTKILDALRGARAVNPSPVVHFQWGSGGERGDKRPVKPPSDRLWNWDDIFKERAPSDSGDGKFWHNWVFGTEILYISGLYLVFMDHKVGGPMMGIGSRLPVSHADVQSPPHQPHQPLEDTSKPPPVHHAPFPNQG